MRIAVIGNGEFFDCSARLRTYDYIIAADGGANHCVRLGVSPHQIVGDGDSISPAATAQYSFQANPDQITTDLQKVIQAISVLPDTTSTLIDLFCFTSHTRLDHTLAAMALLQTDERINTLYTPWQVLYLIRTQHALKATAGTPFSLLPVGPSAIVDITGAQWSGQNIILDQAHSGISNIVKKTPVHVTVRSGMVLCVSKIL